MMQKHLIKCWLWKGLWGVAALAFALAWVSVLLRAPVFQLDPIFLLWNSLILGLLSIPIKLDCQKCETCSVGGMKE